MANVADRRVEHNTLCRGQAVAAILAGAWRRSPPLLEPNPAVLEAILPLLAAGGAGSLVWHRLRESPLRTSRDGRELRQHYRQQTLRAVDREAAIHDLLPRLRSVGIEPILIKGWSSARLYPEPGLRPSCDVDLCVPAGQLETALTALSGPLPCLVDLHADIPDLPDRSWDELFRRSRLESLGQTAVRVLGPEDQLRLLCLHLARHGMARPLWHCDVGVCLEALPALFDWDVFLRGNKQLTNWASCVLGLASRLLTVPIPPVAGLVATVPRRIERAVLWCWGGGPERPLVHYLRHPVEIVRRLRYQGIGLNESTPIKAAFDLGLGPSRSVPFGILQMIRLICRKAPRVFRRLVRPRRRVPLPLSIHAS